jgi:uncharacterized protein DUF3224
MNPGKRSLIILVALACAGVSYALASQAQTTPNQQERVTMNHVTGTFEVKLVPQDDKSDDKTMGRMTIEKTWQGELEGTSKGQMLTGGDPAKGSAGYVAMEKVAGTLKGKKGSFILQHDGTMDRGDSQLKITVVPDSGTGELEGLTGTMTIKIENKKHFYDFEYRIKCACE